MSYSMAQVESLTGIKAHTLRIWERRYNFLQPLRTNTNIRYYSDEQLRKLLNISILINNGFRVSKVDTMTDEEINDHVANLLNNNNHEEHEDIMAMTIAMMEMDEIAFNKIWNSNVAKRGVLSTVSKLIYPFLDHVGVIWVTKKATPAQEHFISSLIRQKVIAATDALPMPAEHAPSIALFLLDGEDHEIGLLLAAFIAKSLGWKVFYLAQKVPYENIKSVMPVCKADLMMTMMITHLTKKKVPDLKKLVEENNTPLIFSGNIPNAIELSQHPDIAYLDRPDALIEYLNDWRKR